MKQHYRSALGAGLLMAGSILSAGAMADSVRAALGLSQTGGSAPSPAQRIVATQQPAKAEPPQTEEAVDPETLPQWFKSAEKLKQLLGGRTPGTLSNPRVIRRLPTDIEGLETLVVEATVTESGAPPRDELFVFYVEPSNTYLMVGMLVNMKDDENLTQLTLRSVRGEIAETPGLALSPLTMHHVVKDGKGDLAEDPVLLVIDFGPEKGRQNFLKIVAFHDQLLAKHEAVRALYVLPVSNSRDELSVGAMAMALGYDLISQDGVERLVEYAEQGADAPWLDSKRLASDAGLKQAMGMGIFRLQDNSEQALLARLDTLPLVYRVVNGTAGLLPTPVDTADWAEAFLPASSTEH